MTTTRNDEKPDCSRFDLWAYTAEVITGGTPLISILPGHLHNFAYRQNPVAINDRLRWTFWAKAGTYELRIVYVTTPTSGIPSVYWKDLDYGVDLGFQTFDTYTAANVYNNIYVTSMTFLRSGKHCIESVVAGKNAASTNYQFWITVFSIWQTALA